MVRPCQVAVALVGVAEAVQEVRGVCLYPLLFRQMIKQILLIGRGANVILGMFMSVAMLKKRSVVRIAPILLVGTLTGGHSR